MLYSAELRRQKHRCLNLSNDVILSYCVLAMETDPSISQELVQAWCRRCGNFAIAQIVDNDVIDSLIAHGHVSMSGTMYCHHVRVHLARHLAVQAVWRLRITGGINLQRTNV